MGDMAAQQTDPQYKVRMPEELHARLKAEAEANKRSMNAEIIARLDESLSDAKRMKIDDVYAFADGAMLGMLQALEAMIKVSGLDIHRAIQMLRDTTNEHLASSVYDKSVVIETLRKIDPALQNVIEQPTETSPARPFR